MVFWGVERYFWVAFCLLSLVWFNEFELQQNAPVINQWFIFFSGLSAYTYLRLPVFFSGLKQKKLGFVPFLIFSSSVSFFLFLLLDRNAQIWSIIGVPFILLYKIPTPYRVLGIKKIPFLKIFVIALVWSIWVVPVAFGLGFSNIFWTRPFVAMFCFCFAITIPFDIRDIDIDRKNKVKTIPHLIGIRASIFLSLLFIFLSLLLFDLDWDYRFVFMIFIFPIIALSGKRRKNAFYFSFCVEGLSFLLYCLKFIFSE
ncbi:UbiA family prenyltransferase [Breoghania sp.]|uniref:UbiA family prenyltransferase n=1 Tax=Breoghania sp. TaxID=2065378 RepID=UPI00262965BC|nr:UbiA family prenyltransferase [Breoghania sp.]MDJ0933701.1 UbiA family prenyltransferase [Breoghania sp.]